MDNNNEQAAPSPLLDICDMKTVFTMAQTNVAVVDRISFTINPGEIVGIVGESGCGKSVTALSIMGLLPKKKAEVVSGNIYFNGEDLVVKKRSEMKKIVGKKIAMIFQEPMTSLNPILKIGTQIGEVLETHENISRTEKKKRVLELLVQVGIDSPEKRYRSYPHQLSGGMRQRVMIAMALACKPDLLIADEPTTALDVTIQAQILDLIKTISKAEKMAVLIITHDLGVIAEMAEKVIVMYAGKIIEQAPVQDLFNAPQHPYTDGLLRSVPRVEKVGGTLYSIEGTVPTLNDLPHGCRFSTRCELCKEICTEFHPDTRKIEPKRELACWRGTGRYENG